MDDREAKPLWKIIKGWKSFFYGTDSYVVSRMFISENGGISSHRAVVRGFSRGFIVKLKQKALDAIFVVGMVN